MLDLSQNKESDQTPENSTFPVVSEESNNEFWDSLLAGANWLDDALEHTQALSSNPVTIDTPPEVEKLVPDNGLHNASTDKRKSDQSTETPPRKARKKYQSKKAEQLKEIEDLKAKLSLKNDFIEILEKEIQGLKSSNQTYLTELAKASQLINYLRADASKLSYANQRLLGSNLFIDNSRIKLALENIELRKILQQRGVTVPSGYVQENQGNYFNRMPPPSASEVMPVPPQQASSMMQMQPVNSVSQWRENELDNWPRLANPTLLYSAPIVMPRVDPTQPNRAETSQAAVNSLRRKI